MSISIVLLWLQAAAALCSSRCTFDATLRGILNRADTLGSTRAAVEAELAGLDETFLPALQARIDEAPTEELFAVMEAFGEIFWFAEPVLDTATDRIIAHHWNKLESDFWTLDQVHSR